MPEFQPHELKVHQGTLAISAMPGRTRHYGADWQRLLDWRPQMVVTLCGQAELDRKGAGSLGADLRAQGIDWAHVPVTDFGAPDEAAEALWPDIERRVLTLLQSGGRVLVHCFGGCGRSGMAVLRLMIAAGEAPDAALARLRHVRPCAVETDAQMAWATQLFAS
ncbi:MAG: protein phosphatase [Loktanella sp.]|nr:protein phosphatase [Loktanella sp.]